MHDVARLLQVADSKELSATLRSTIDWFDADIKQSVDAMKGGQ